MTGALEGLSSHLSAGFWGCVNHPKVRSSAVALAALMLVSLSFSGVSFALSHLFTPLLILAPLYFVTVSAMMILGLYALGNHTHHGSAPASQAH